MNLHKKMCIGLSIVFILSIIIFCFVKNAHPTISNILIAIITGAFISLYTSIVNYLHLKEEFFNTLFYNGVFINSSYEQIHKLIEKLDSTSNMEPVVNTFQNYADSISKLISNINFTEYSPFFNNSEEAKTVNYIDGLLCHTTLTFIILEISKIKVQQLSLSKQDICERLNHLSEMDLQKIEKQKNQIHNAIDILYKNTKAIQADFLGKMDYLHKKTNNKTRWFEGTRGIVESTEKNIDNYVKSSINIKK